MREVTIEDVDEAIRIRNKFLSSEDKETTGTMIDDDLSEGHYIDQGVDRQIAMDRGEYDPN